MKQQDQEVAQEVTLHDQFQWKITMRSKVAKWWKNETLLSR